MSQKCWEEEYIFQEKNVFFELSRKNFSLEDLPEFRKKFILFVLVSLYWLYFTYGDVPGQSSGEVLAGLDFS